MVKRCIEKSSGLEFAVKIVRTNDEEIVENMIKEFNHLKKIHHRNIIQVKELIKEKESGIYYLIMELFHGMEMFLYISEIGTYSEKIAKFLFLQLVQGIKHLH